MKISALFPSAIMLGLLAATGAYAQDSLTIDQTLNDVGPAPLDRGLSPRTSVEFSAGEDDGEIAIRLGFGQFTLTATAPADDDGSTDLATLDGFANATTLELGYTGVVGRLKAPDESAEAICLSIDANYSRNGQCDADYVATHGTRRQLRDFLRLTRQQIYFWGVSAKVGHQEFDYFEPITLASQTDERTPWSVSGFIAGQPFGDPTLVTLSAEYAEDYQAAQSLIVCPGGVPPVVCVQGPIGGPSRVDRALVSLEARRSFEFGSEGQYRFGVSAMVTHDLESDITGIDVPIYFFQDGDGALTGGLRFGWRDDRDDVTVGLFVGKAFSIF